MLRQKRGPSEFLRRKAVLAANLVLLALMGWGFAGEFVRNRDMQKEIDRLSAQADGLAAKNFEIAQIGQKLASSDTLEREARLNLGLQKPGESVIIVRDTAPPPPAAPADAVQTDAPPSESNAVKWWRYFFHAERQ